MNTELLIVNRSSGRIWECSNSVESVSWETNRTDTPGKLTFTILKSGDLSFTEGDVVRFSVDGQLQFYGWVFTKSKNRWGEIDVTCYDRLRYFKANASYTFYSQKAGDIIRQIAGDLQVEVGELADTGYPIPSLSKEDQSCFDIIGEAVQQTLLNTGDIYVFYDGGSGVALRRPEDMAPLKACLLYLTEPVVEKKIPGTVACIENGETLPVEDGYTILNRGLEPGDAVLLLRVERGQKYIVLSRIMEGG